MAVGLQSNRQGKVFKVILDPLGIFTFQTLSLSDTEVFFTHTRIFYIWEQRSRTDRKKPFRKINSGKSQNYNIQLGHIILDCHAAISVSCCSRVLLFMLLLYIFIIIMHYGYIDPWHCAAGLFPRLIIWKLKI